MTDDKGAGEGMDKLPEDLFRKWWLNNSEAGLTPYGIGFYAFTSGFNAGRKAERERCALIAETEIVEHQDGEESYLCGTGKLIAEKIRGGQDGN